MKKVKGISLVMLTIFVLVTLISIPSCKKQEEKVIKIGAILPLTGNLAFLGDPGKNAISLLRMQLGEENMVKVNLYDSKGDPATALSVFRKALSMDRVKIFLTTLTGVSLAIKPVAEKEGVFQGIIAIYPEISKNYKNAFQICYNAVEESKLIIDYLKRKKPQKVFIFASRDPITELQVNRNILPFLKKEGIGVQVEHFNIGEKDFKSIVLKFAQSNASLGILLGYGSDFQGILREIRNQGLSEKIPLIGGIGYLELPDYVDYEFVKNSVFTAPEFIVKGLEPEKFKRFYKEYKSRFDKEPTYDAAYTYDAILILNEAIKALKTDDPDKISEYLLSHSFDGVTGPIKFDENGTLKVKLRLARFNKNMEIVLVK